MVLPENGSLIITVQFFLLVYLTLKKTIAFHKIWVNLRFKIKMYLIITKNKQKLIFFHHHLKNAWNGKLHGMEIYPLRAIPMQTNVVGGLELQLQGDRFLAFSYQRGNTM